MSNTDGDGAQQHGRTTHEAPTSQQIAHAVELVFDWETYLNAGPAETRELEWKAEVALKRVSRAESCDYDKAIELIRENHA